MRTFAATALLLALSGCYYDRPNPWDTSGDAEDYQDKVEEDWILETRDYRADRRTDGPALYDPQIEAWRDTVLATAEPSTLVPMRTWIVSKLGELGKRRAEILKADPHSRKELILRVDDEIRIERIRLKLLEERLGASGR
jgi:hypothetical protein